MKKERKHEIASKNERSSDKHNDRNANIIKKEEHDIYSYCYEFLFENIVYIASIILFGALLHNLKETLIFLLVMIPFRTFARRSACSRIRSVCCSFLSELFYYDAFL